MYWLTRRKTVNYCLSPNIFENLRLTSVHDISNATRSVIRGLCLSMQDIRALCLSTQDIRYFCLSTLNYPSLVPVYALLFEPCVYAQSSESRVCPRPAKLSEPCGCSRKTIASCLSSSVIRALYLFMQGIL